MDTHTDGRRRSDRALLGGCEGSAPAAAEGVPADAVAGAVEVGRPGSLRTAAHARAAGRARLPRGVGLLPGLEAGLSLAVVDERPRLHRADAALPPQEAARRVDVDGPRGACALRGRGAREEQLLHRLARGAAGLETRERVDRRLDQALGLGAGEALDLAGPWIRRTGSPTRAAPRCRARACRRWGCCPSCPSRRRATRAGSVLDEGIAR